jgi:hypothetical protein
MRNTAASCFLSTRVGDCVPTQLLQLRRSGGRQDGGRNFGKAPAPAPSQQKTDNAQQCRRHNALMRNTAASSFLSTRAGDCANPVFSQLRRSEDEQDGGRNFSCAVLLLLTSKKRATRNMRRPQKRHVDPGATLRIHSSVGPDIDSTENVLRRYVVSMGIDPGFIDAAVKVSSRTFRGLSRGEMEKSVLRPTASMKPLGSPIMDHCRLTSFHWSKMPIKQSSQSSALKPRKRRLSILLRKPRH